MPQKGLIYRVLVASPSDVVPERKAIPEVIYAWNAVHSLHTGAILEPVLWETHARPELGDRPQGIINRQLVENCDLVVGAFWTRLGTPTGLAESGTAEEIEQFRAAGKPVLLYFSSAPVVPESLDLDQYKALTEFKKRLREAGLCGQYEAIGDLREQLQRHLTGTMAELLKIADGTREGSLPNSSPETEAVRTVRMYKSQFETFLRRLESEWVSERDSRPMNIDEGQFILRNALSEVLEFRSQITRDDTEISLVLDDAAKRIRSLQRHRLYLDGGASFRAFWTGGDEVITLLKRIPTLLQATLTEADASDRASHL